VGGYVKKYNGITYCTVRNAGHMVPQYQPYPAFILFQAYLNGEL
jgi:carboxypeptidase C (cathepsin A)